MMVFSGLSHTVAGLRIKRVFRERWGLISWMGIPIIIVFLMSLIAGSGGGQITGKILITDHDDSTLSQFLAGGFAQGPLAEIFTLKAVSEEQGQTMMDAGEASAWITIEAGFGSAFLNSEPTQLELVKNPAQSILPQMVETSLKLLVDAATYIQLLFDKELAALKPMLENQQFNDADLVVLTLGIKQQIDRLESTLFPPQLKLIEKVVEEAQEQQDITFGMLMFPGAIFMALIFSANSLAVSLWDDASNGVIPRLSATPSALGAYFFGQLLAVVVVFSLITGLLSVLGAWYFDLRWDKVPMMVMWLVFSGLVIWLLFCLFSLLMPTSKAANITINATSFPLLMVGGSFFPMEAMPAWLAQVGQFLPNGFMLKGLKDWLIRQEPLMDALLFPAVLGLVMVVVLLVINLKLIKKLVQKV